MTAAPDDALAERVRHAIDGDGSVREVRMFGGLAFLLDERMLVSVGRDGELLVRVDPAADPVLVARPGARRAEMGAGRSMGPGWITVSRDAIDGDGLRFWLDAALGARPAPEPDRVRDGASGNGSTARRQRGAGARRRDPGAGRT